MGKKKFSGYRIAFLAGLYMFMLGGITATFSVIYAFLPEHFHVSITRLALGGSVGVFSAMIFGLFAAKVIDWFKPRFCMLFGGILVLLYGIVNAYVRSFLGVVLAFLCIGAILAFAHQSVVTALLIPWFVEKRATMISICVATGMFGMFVFQLLAGQSVEKLGVQTLYLVFAGAAGIVLILCALGVRNTPEELGETALGSEELEAQSADMDGNMATAGKSVKELYKNPVFWLMVVATLLVGSAVSQIGTYMTLYFPSVGGMEYQKAAIVVSILGLASGVCTTFSGRIMEKLGIRKFIILLMSGAFLANLCTALYSKYQGILMIVLIVVFYSMGFSVSYISNILVTPLFGEAFATEANTKLLAVLQGGNALIVPMYASLFETLSYPKVYLIIGGVNCATLILYLAAMSVAKKRGVAV